MEASVMDNNEDNAVEETVSTVVDAIKEETTQKVGKVKGFFSAIKKTFSSTVSKVTGLISNEKAADGIMRWPRPVAFFLTVAMFLIGWFHPAALLAFAQAISALPDHFWDVIFIILGSIGVSKGANDIAKILSARK